MNSFPQATDQDLILILKLKRISCVVLLKVLDDFGKI